MSGIFSNNISRSNVIAKNATHIEKSFSIFFVNDCYDLYDDYDKPISSKS
jgi:hypothetical protein